MQRERGFVYETAERHNRGREVITMSRYLHRQTTRNKNKGPLLLQRRVAAVTAAPKISADSSGSQR